MRERSAGGSKKSPGRYVHEGMVCAAAATALNAIAMCGVQRMLTRRNRESMPPAVIIGAVNDDVVLNNFDIAPFVVCILSAGCP